MVIETNEKEFKDIIKKDGKVLVDCYANWCGPCKMLSPIIDEVASDINSVAFYKLDVDEAEEVSNKYGIMTIPTLLLFENGTLIRQTSGFITKDEVIDFINK